MRRCLVVAPGATVVSTVGDARSLESSFVEIERGLEVVEERLAALAPHTHLAEPHVRELHEIRRLMAALSVGGLGARHPLASGLVGASAHSLAVADR